MSALSKMLRAKRKRLGITTREVTENGGPNRSYVCNLENATSNSENLTIKTIKQLAKGLGLSGVAIYKAAARTVKAN